MIGPPFGLYTFLIIILCGIAMFLPAYILGKPLYAKSHFNNAVWNGSLTKYMPAISSGFLFLSLVVYLYSRRGVVGMGTEEARAMRQEFEGDSGLIRVFNLMSPFALMSAYWIMSSVKSVLLRAAYVISIMLGFVVTYQLTGSRFEFVGVIVVSLSAVTIFNGSWLLARWKSVALSAMVVFFLSATGNSVLNLSGMRGGWSSENAQTRVNRGAMLTEKLGGNRAPDIILLTIGLAEEYLVMPLSYLDHYFEYSDLPPAKGAHQFRFIARRFGEENASRIKLMVDDLYLDIGIVSNVWATSIREMAIDTGKKFLPLGFLVLGIIMGISKRFFSISHGARCMLCLMVAFNLLGPMVSLFKSHMFHIGFLFCLLWMLVDIIIFSDRAHRIRAGSLSDLPDRLQI